MNTTAQTAPVIQLKTSMARPRAPQRSDRSNLIVLIVAAALAFSPLAFGYYSFTSWAPLGIGAGPPGTGAIIAPPVQPPQQPPTTAAPPMQE